MTDDTPKHKPQKKHTLDEVLKSLQDLIRNDLISAPPAPTPADPPPTPTADNPEPPPSSLDNALDTLDRLIDRELVEPIAQARTAAVESPPTADELPDDENWPDDDTVISESLAADEALSAADDGGKDLATEAVTTPAATAGSDQAQNAFAFDEPTPAAADAAADIGEPPAAIADPEPSAADDVDPSDTADMALRAKQSRALPDDDIPVLREVAHEVLAAANDALPGPDRARAIAIQVVARLNIELRRDGAPPLDPSTIDRLQRLLFEALTSKSFSNP